MTNLIQTTIPSPVGDMTVIIEDDTVILAEFSDQPQRIEKYLAKHHAGKSISASAVTDNKGGSKNRITSTGTLTAATDDKGASMNRAASMGAVAVRDSLDGNVAATAATDSSTNTLPQKDEMKTVVASAHQISFVGDVEQAFAAYFAGDTSALDELKINASGSDFDRKVWAALRTIPAGETWSYADLAVAVNSHPRAVGGANGRNPVALITPCHRVIAVDGSLTGYAGGVERKKWLLEMERGIKSLV